MKRFSSFHVTAECEDPKVMYDPQVWPTGTYIRRFYEPRKHSRATPTNQDVVGVPDRINEVTVSVEDNGVQTRLATKNNSNIQSCKL